MFDIGLDNRLACRSGRYADLSRGVPNRTGLPFPAGRGRRSRVSRSGGPPDCDFYAANSRWEIRDLARARTRETENRRFHILLESFQRPALLSYKNTINAKHVGPLGVQMLAYTIVILICSMSTDHADCQAETAIDVVRGPRVENVMMCAMGGQTIIAQTALAHGDGHEYLKILCLPSAREPRTADVTKSEDE
jgi:hypothetical protein